MWLRIPTSHCFPATEDSTLPSNALCQALAASVSWRGKLLRPQSWRLAWRTEAWRKHLSGLTLPPSQADSSVAAWLDLSAGFPARTSALPADKPESRESGADCSLKSSDSFASWSPSSGCFLKTSRQFSIFQQAQPFSENLPRSGSMRNGELFERPMLVDRTGESGRLCWPTARAEDFKHGEATDYEIRREKAMDLLHVKAERMMRMWHTPKAHEYAETSGTFVSRNADRGAHCLRGLGAKTTPKPDYQTPLPNETSNEYWERMTAYETENGIDPTAGGMHWPTPQACDVKSPDMEGSGRYERIIKNGWQIHPNSAAAKWPTPAARDYRSPNAASHMDRSTGAKHLDQLPNFIEHSFLPVPATSTHGAKSPNGSTRRLNADFVDWLMGLIPGWTDYAPLETASYLSRVRSLLRFYLGGHAK